MVISLGFHSRLVFAGDWRDVGSPRRGEMFIAAVIQPTFQRRSEGRNSTWEVLICIIPPLRTTQEFRCVTVYRHVTPTE